jgi:hypothetical protein
MQVKSGITNDSPSLNDRTAVSRASVAELKRFAELHGLEFEDRLVQSIFLPHDSISLKACAWMAGFFGLMGDSIPNSNGK